LSTRSETRTARSRTIKEKKLGNSLSLESISIPLKSLLILRALRLSIKRISIHRNSHFSLAKEPVTCKLFNSKRLFAIDVRRMNNGVFNAMTDEE
ncbi:hypothetical protein T07_14664, partial [Trichinella nelsoni]